MPNAPVVFDDGGSTRIKQLKNCVNMDSLLGMPGPGGSMVFNGTANGAFINNQGKFKCHLAIRTHQEDGDQEILPNAETIDPSSGVDLKEDDVIVITSQNGQVATVSFSTGTFLLQIALTAGAGIIPLVEAKQNQLQRRYVVSNAGSISAVDLIRRITPPPAPPAPQTNTLKLFKLQVPPSTEDTASIYTMVHFH